MTYLVPLGVADIKRAGRDVTVVATGLTVHKSLAAADILAREGIEVEVIDPRTLVPLDRETHPGLGPTRPAGWSWPARTC